MVCEDENVERWRVKERHRWEGVEDKYTLLEKKRKHKDPRIQTHLSKTKDPFWISLFITTLKKTPYLYHNKPYQTSHFYFFLNSNDLWPNPACGTNSENNSHTYIHTLPLYIWIYIIHVCVCDSVQIRAYTIYTPPTMKIKHSS